MGQSGGGAQHHRLIIGLADLIGQLRELLRLLGVRGLKDRDLGRAADGAGILLILGAVEARVVGDRHDHTAVHSGVGHGIERIRRHVVAHHLHAGERADAGDRGSEGHFGGYLLIGRPLTVHAVLVPDQVLADLRARRARIGAGDLDARLVETAGNGLISQHQFLLTHNNSSSLLFLLYFL